MPNKPYEAGARDEARAAGLKQYLSNRPCKGGHSPVIRYVSVGTCVKCVSETQDRWRKANPEKWRDIWKSWREKNPDKMKEIDERYRSKDPKSLRQMRRVSEQAYRDKHPDRIIVKGHKRRAVQRACVGSFSEEDIQDLMREQGGKCAACLVSIEDKRHIDHIMPLILGGSNDRSNIQLLCVTCNLRKGAKHPMEFAKYMSQLR